MIFCSHTLVKCMMIICINLCCINSICADIIDIKHVIEQKIRNIDSDLNIGIKIKNLDRNQIIFEKNSNRYYIPASALKFITIISLIEFFGDDHKFVTTLFKDKTNYFLDIQTPDFTTKNLDTLIQAIAESNQGKTIIGDIFIIKQEFTVPSIMRDKIYSDTLYCYGAPISKIHINKNCCKVIAIPGRINSKIKIQTDQYFPYNIVNNAKTLAKNREDRVHLAIQGKNYIINGTLNASRNKVEIGAVSNNSFNQLKYYIQHALQKHGIKLQGQILLSPVRSLESSRIQKVRSIECNIQDIASIALKRSDNFITDYLLAEFATIKKQDEWRGAIKHLKYMIGTKFNLDLEKSVIKDGSGISRLNLLSINQLDEFLYAVSKMPHFNQIKTLMAQTSDNNSTLKGRFKSDRKIYAKTGHLSNVSNIIGYFYNAQDELHSFVIAINNFYGSRIKYDKLQEEIIESMINYHAK